MQIISQKSKPSRRGVVFAVMIAAASLVGSQSAFAADYPVNSRARTAGFPNWDLLKVRAWPAARSREVGGIEVGRRVWVERCILKSGTDWCQVSHRGIYGWVNGRFIYHRGRNFARPHPKFY